MHNIDFTPLELGILQASGNVEVTLRRRRLVLVTGTLFAGVLLAGTLMARRWEVPLCVGLLYIGMTVFEKIAYANAVLGYKSVVRKLSRRIDELEASPSPPS